MNREIFEIRERGNNCRVAEHQDGAGTRRRGRPRCKLAGLHAGSGELCANILVEPLHPTIHDDINRRGAGLGNPAYSGAGRVPPRGETFDAVYSLIAA